MIYKIQLRKFFPSCGNMDATVYVVSKLCKSAIAQAFEHGFIIHRVTVWSEDDSAYTPEKSITDEELFTSIVFTKTIMALSKCMLIETKRVKISNIPEGVIVNPYHCYDDSVTTFNFKNTSIFEVTSETLYNFLKKDFDEFQFSASGYPYLKGHWEFDNGDLVKYDIEKVYCNQTLKEVVCLKNL